MGTAKALSKAQKDFPLRGTAPLKNILSQIDQHHPHILSQKIRDLGLKLEGSVLENLIQKLFKELEATGISFKPACYLSNEWGCPHGIPAIGIPFYLVDHELSKIELETMHEIEGENEDEIMKILRHEAGHAFNYAYQLYKTSAWRKIFGKISEPYSDHYRPNPFSKKFVKHLDNWYAQKHPDDDFAETFAVWITPDSDWHKRYKGWGAYKKLEYVGEVVRKYAGKPSKVTSLDLDQPVEKMDITLEEYYVSKLEEVSDELPERFDPDLIEIFSKEMPNTSPAEAFIQEHKTNLINTISNWTGEKKYIVRMLLSKLCERTKELNLFVLDSDRDKTYAHLLTYCTTLTMNYRYLGRFFIY